MLEKLLLLAGLELTDSEKVLQTYAEMADYDFSMNRKTALKIDVCKIC